MSQRPTARLAEFTANLRYENLPSDVVAAAKAATLDTLACGLLGAQLEPGKIISRFVQQQGGAGEATLWGGGIRVPVEQAALAAGVQGHSFDIDDYHHLAKLHPGVVVVPTALCLAEALGANGRRFLTAVVAGYEVMIRVSMGIGPVSSRRRGWHLTGTCGPFGAAAATAVLLGLDPADTVNAFGLAGTQSSGLWAFLDDGAMSKRFHPGRAAQNGLLAARLAAAGFTGPATILEAEDGGLCRATSDDWDFDSMTRRLGESYETARVSFKPYASCASTHSSIDAVLQVMEEHDLRVDQIERVEVGIPRLVEFQCGRREFPETVLQGQMNLRYCLAVAAIDGEVSVQQFSPERMSGPQVRRLFEKVDLTVDPEIDADYPRNFSSRVSVTLSDGRQLQMFVENPSGSWAKPLTHEQLEQKFRSLSAGVLGQERQDRVLALVDQLDDLVDVGQLAELLA